MSFFSYWRFFNLVILYCRGNLWRNQNACGGAAQSAQPESCVRGHHVFKTTWTPTIGEELDCKREHSNTFDPYAVAVKRRNAFVGHIPRKLVFLCQILEQRHDLSASCERGTRVVDRPAGNVCRRVVFNIGEHLICRFSLKSPNRQIKSLANFSRYTVILGQKSEVGTHTEKPPHKLGERLFRTIGTSPITWELIISQRLQ